MGPTWGPSGADRTQVGTMLAQWTLLSGDMLEKHTTKSKRKFSLPFSSIKCKGIMTWKYFLPFEKWAIGHQRISFTKGQWCGALLFSLFWPFVCTNVRDVSDMTLWRPCDVTFMFDSYAAVNIIGPVTNEHSGTTDITWYIVVVVTIYHCPGA